MFAALWESLGFDSPIIRKHINSLTSGSHGPQLGNVSSRTALDPFWVCGVTLNTS